jgi:uncharacterized protein (DUF885 family)
VKVDPRRIPEIRHSVRAVGTVSEISERFVDAFAALDPAAAARGMGVGLDDETMTDYSPDGEAALADLYRRTLAELAAATPEDESERLGAGYLEDLCATRLALIETGERSCLLNELGGAPAAVRQLFDLVDRSTPEAWARVGIRLGQVPAAIEGYRQSLSAGLAAGHRSTVRLAEAVAGQCATWAGDGGGGWFGRYVADAADPALDALARDAAAAYGELATWLRQTYAPAAATEDGVGPERYRVWAAAMLGADLDPGESYAWGCDELARLEAEKAVECERIVPGAGFGAVRDLLLTDPDRAVHGVDAYRGWLQGVVDEATDALSGEQFDIPDVLRRCDVGIPPVGTAAAPYYTPPSEDLSVPGRVWFPTLGEVSFPTWADVTTAYHEAVPGHHLQFGCSHMASLTRAHRLGFQTAHGEGWALYAERLMDELGWFRTPDTRLGFLSSQAFRAVRVVVDIGLHLGRTVPAGLPGAGQPWGFDTAVAALEAAGGLTGEHARSEVVRYLSWPAQATSYKLGERSWLAGRDAARTAAGASFDLRRWHARALAFGSLGLDRLERELAAL